MISIALPFIAMSSAISGYFAAVRRVYKTAFSNFFEQIVKIMFTMLFLDKFLGIGLESACFCLILADIISEIASFLFSFLLYHFDKKHLHFGISISNILPRVFRVSFPLAITSYVRSALSTLKQVLITSSLEKSGMDCANAFAEYGVISGMAMPVILFPSILITTFSNLLIPEFTRYYTKKDFKRIKEVSRLIFLITSLFSCLVIIIFFFLSDWISLKLYSDFSISYYLKLFCPLIIIMYLDMVIYGILKGLDGQTSVMVVNVLDLTITTSFIYFFVPRLGIVGYIFSIFISEIVNFLASLKKLLKIKKIGGN